MRALVLSAAELEEASPREQRMKGVFLSHKCVDESSPALPASAPFLFSSLSSLCSSLKTDKE